MNNPNPAPISDLSPVDPRVQPAGAAAGAVEERPTPPDLLATLREIRDGMVAARNDIGVDDWIDLAEAAIAKAEGGS